jgi:DNA-binding transcriptional MerR regulator
MHMPQDSLLTISDISRELNVGVATLKFVLTRFQQHFPFHSDQGRHLYSAGLLSHIAQVIQLMDMGVLPSEIEKQLNGKESDASAAFENNPDSDIRLSRDALDLLQSLFHDISQQQRRIAQAHEKRAEAEERKAVAIEKRAEAEEKKANAINNIATALQDMNRLRAPLDPVAEKIAHEAVSVITTDEAAQEAEVADTQDRTAPDTDSRYDEDSLEDDLDALIDENGLLDDLIIDEDLEDPLAKTEETDEQMLELDDLSSLISDRDDAGSERIDNLQDLDDLSALIDDVSEDNTADFQEIKPAEADGTDNAVPTELDDLSELIDTGEVHTAEAASPEEPEAEELDDLSLLIESTDGDPDLQDSSRQMDDLSLLIETPDSDAAEPAQNVSLPPEMDDLSKLIEPADEQKSQGDMPQPDEPQMDDLSQLIETDSDAGASEDAPPGPEQPKITITVTPEEDTQKYKAEIMKVIIDLKNKGNDAQATTDILNANQLRTLSGKPEWSLKAIAQIYKFIESAG